MKVAILMKLKILSEALGRRNKAASVASDKTENGRERSRMWELPGCNRCGMDNFLPTNALNHVPLDNLRLELTPNCFYLLPYHHLEVAKFESGHDGDMIALSFVNHNVKIAGRNLRALAIGFQERAVEWVMPVPEKYSEVWESARGLIQSIEIEKPEDLCSKKTNN